MSWMPRKRLDPARAAVVALANLWPDGSELRRMLVASTRAKVVIDFAAYLDTLARVADQHAFVYRLAIRAVNGEPVATLIEEWYSFMNGRKPT